MTEKTIWICDGCDAELVRRRDQGTDWKTAAIQLSGFEGYPTNADANPVHLFFHVCPSCAKRYFRDANPRNWVRTDPEPQP